MKILRTLFLGFLLICQSSLVLAGDDTKNSNSNLQSLGEIAVDGLVYLIGSTAGTAAFGYYGAQFGQTCGAAFGEKVAYEIIKKLPEWMIKYTSVPGTVLSLGLGIGEPLGQYAGFVSLGSFGFTFGPILIRAVLWSGGKLVGFAWSYLYSEPTSCQNLEESFAILLESGVLQEP